MPQYDPKKIESEVYLSWEKTGLFSPDNLPKNRKKTYSISLPPPNITGVLHMGHALNGTIQDILIRYNRMKGLKTLWMPGIDHAGIATQNKVEKKIKKEGKRRKDIGRESFEKEVWEWKKEYGGLIIGQMKTMGFSCDWSRLRFTMDDRYSEAVKEAFIHYYNRGLIYRGPRIVNWCPRCETAISDIEIKHREENGKLWYIKYPLFKNPKSEIRNPKQIQSASWRTKFQTIDFIVVATTRPETMLGDVAVAVNPKDDRYKDLIGRAVILPIVNRKIPIVADRLVEKDFGTGAVKVTPAHDMTDNRIAKNHNLPVINVINEYGRMSDDTGEFAGLKVLEAREKIVEKLKSQNLIEKEEDYEHSVSICERCEAVIEPIISTQWFVKMNELARPAIKAVRENKIKFIPSRYKKIYLDWMEKIEDWCVSRQLWWGHRLPVYFCKSEKNEKSQAVGGDFVVAEKKPEKCSVCGECEMEQSDEVLDTWFSSALWPFATLGWPQKTKELKEFYPNNFLSTAQEILYLWVARMIFSGLEFADNIPFHDVYIHPTVLNIDGQRMSKSLGTGVDPLDLIDKHGADALRFGIILQTSRDQQSFKFSEEYVVAGRKFANKLWNIDNFIRTAKNSEQRNRKNRKTLADKWIVSRLNAVIREVEKNIKEYKFDKSLNTIYEFAWHEFADWYLEINKIDEFQNIKLLEKVFSEVLILLHPFMPFITERLWGVGEKSEMVIIQNWPKIGKSKIDESAEKEFANVKKTVLIIRKKRAEKDMPFSERIKIRMPARHKISAESRMIAEKLTRADIV